MSTTAYLYRWTQKSTGMWYEGSRTRKGCHPNDGYICSSKTVAPMITENFADWTREILVIGEPVYIRKLEEMRLNDLDAKNDPMSYNEDNADGKFTTTGKPAWNRGKKQPRGTPSWNSGKKAPQISAAKKGKPAPNKGVPMSEKQKVKLSVAHTGKVSPKKGKPGPLSTPKANAKRSATLKGRKQSTEWVEKRAASKRGKPNTGASIALKGRAKPKVVSRLHDRKPMTASNFVQWCKLQDNQASGIPHPNKGKSKSADTIARRTATRLKNKLLKTKEA